MILGEKAREAYRLQQYGIAEQYYLQAIEQGKRLEFRDKGLSNYYTLFWIYSAEGRYKEAIEAGGIYGQYISSITDKSKWPYYCEMASLYHEYGKDDMVLRFCELAAKDREEYLAGHRVKMIPDGPNSVGHLEKVIREDREIITAQIDVYLGKYYLRRGEYEKARDRFQESFDNLAQNNLMRTDYTGRSQMLLGMTYHYLGDDSKAEELLRGSAGANAGSFVVEADDLAQEVAVLGNIEERRGAADKALKDYDYALRMLRGARSEERRTQQADALNQLGGFYLRQTNLEESSKAYHEAKSLREATTTATHPEYAVTMKGLATIAVSRNELTSATLLARKALDVLDASVVRTHARIAPVLVALSSIEILNGHPEEAAKLNQRLETLLQDRPLAIWKEDFLWTVDFYAGILQKTGKQAEADALKQIYARQKDRR